MGRMTSKTAPARTLLLIVAACLAGCQKKDDTKDTTKKPSGKKATTTTQRTDVVADSGTTKKTVVKPAKVVVAPPPPIAQVPPVKMSKRHRDAMTVFQNDALPAAVLDGQLLGLDGKTHTLRSELGPSLTVLLFWSSDHAYSVEELGYLADNVLKHFGSDGVKIVTINQRDTQERAKEAAANAGASALVTLLDSDKTLSQLADGKVPRTYLLDTQGRVLWLDTVFDRTTKRDLNGALDFVLNKSKGGASTAHEAGDSKHR